MNRSRHGEPGEGSTIRRFHRVESADARPLAGCGMSLSTSLGTAIFGVLKSFLPSVVMVCTAAIVLAAGPVNAGSLDAPQGRVILEIRGNISNTNGQGVARFDRQMLESLPQETVATVTPWTDGQTIFTGPLARAVLNLVGAAGKQVEAVALNDYGVVIPIDDFEDYRVILAMLMNGKPMGTRDKGPLWVIYPWSEHPELQTVVVHGRSIWQLKAMNVKE